MEEIDFAVKIFQWLNLPNGVVGILFTVGMYIRSVSRQRNDRFKEFVELEVKRKLDYIYSKAYVEMEQRVYDIRSKHGNGALITVRRNDGVEDVPLGAYKTGYKESLQEVAFKIILPCVVGKIIDDKRLWKGKHWKQYTVDTGTDIQQSFTTRLGRKTGITDFSGYIIEDALTEDVFVEMYSKIIRSLRERR